MVADNKNINSSIHRALVFQGGSLGAYKDINEELSQYLKAVERENEPIFHIVSGLKIPYCSEYYENHSISISTLSVVTRVDNTNGGTKQPSDFTITVSGNRPSPRTFSGSSSGTSVRLSPGSYEVTSNNIHDYSTGYSPGCSGTASGGVPIKCTITNEFHGEPAPSLPTLPNKPPL